MIPWRELWWHLLRGLSFWTLAAVAAWFAWATLLGHTVLAGDDLTLVLLTVPSLWLIAAWRSARRRQARLALLDTARSQWRDGDAVAIAGRLGGGRIALHAPISGQPAALYQHRLVRHRSKGGPMKYGFGLRLADAELATSSGPLELKGLPSLDDAPETGYRDAESLRHYARHLLGGAVELAEPVGAFDVRGTRAKLRDGIAIVTECVGNEHGQIAHELVRPQHLPLQRDPLPWERATALAAAGQLDAAARLLGDAMHGANFEAFEQVLPPGAEVCVYGTWHAAERRLGIGATPRPDREHGLYGLARSAWLESQHRSARWRLRFCAGLLLAVLLPLLFLIAPSIERRPWREGLVQLPQLYHAVRGDPAALRPLLGSTTRPDDVARGIEAQHQANYLELLRQQRAAQPPASAARRWAEALHVIPERGPVDPPPLPPEPPEADRLRAISALLHFGIDLDALDADDRLLLFDARGATLELLLRAGADARRTNSDGWSALHFAASDADPERVEMLLRAGARADARNAQGYSALDVAQHGLQHTPIPGQKPYYERVVALMAMAIDTDPG